RSTSTNFSYVNGRATTAFVQNLVFVAEKEGTYEIGPASVTSGRETVSSEKVSIQIRPAGSSANVPQLGDEDFEDDHGDLLVLGKVDDANPYVNEQITYTFTFLRAVRILEGSRYTPPTTTGFWTEEIDTTEPREVTLEGRRYIAERLRFALFPTGPGEYEIGPATLTTTVEDRSRRRRRDPFDIFGSDPFSLLRGGREVRLQTDPVAVKVRPLPTEGKPADFSGAVGRFQLTATTDRTESKAGEPITLTVKLSGEGNVKVVPTPDLDDWPGFKIYESSSNEKSYARDGKIQGEKTWEWVLVPSSGTASEIPAIEISTFDPTRDAYVRLHTDPIPLDVEATALDDVLAGGGDLNLAKERVRLRQRDIRWVKNAPAEFGRPVASPWARPWVLAAHVAPLFVLGGSVVWRRHRDRLRQDVRYARRRGAARAADRRFRSAADAQSAQKFEGAWGEISAGLRGYVADRFHLAAANLDEGSVREGLRAVQVPEERIDDLFRLLERCDGARFSPLGADAQAVADAIGEARTWVDEVERR
ncbi:MAG: protein BatD, partial [Gemmatimonadetes bacterium]|nr:protein BatD [Gemmatimonadota bacterium]